jgi:hypothetical protein
MKSTQAWGWLAAGVVALGLNGFYHDGGAEWAHRFVNRVGSRSAAVVALASGHADRFLEEARLLTANDEPRSCKFTTEMARWQARVARGQAGFAHVEAMSAREQAALARIEANRARIEAQVARVQFLQAQPGTMNLHIACPHVRANAPLVQIPQIRIPRVEIPEINVPDTVVMHAGSAPL